MQTNCPLFDSPMIFHLMHCIRIPSYPGSSYGKSNYPMSCRIRRLQAVENHNQLQAVSRKSKANLEIVRARKRGTNRWTRNMRSVTDVNRSQKY